MHGVFLVNRCGRSPPDPEGTLGLPAERVAGFAAKAVDPHWLEKLEEKE
jgi:hypothetical protein